MATFRKALAAMAAASALALGACGSDTSDSATTSTETSTEPRSTESTSADTSDTGINFGDPITIEEAQTDSGNELTMAERGITIVAPSDWVSDGLTEGGTIGFGAPDGSALIVMNEIGNPIPGISAENYATIMERNTQSAGGTVENLGDSTIGGLPAYKLSVTTTGMTGYTYYFEKDGIAYEAYAIGEGQENIDLADQTLQGTKFDN